MNKTLRQTLLWLLFLVNCACAVCSIAVCCLIVMNHQRHAFLVQLFFVSCVIAIASGIISSLTRRLESKGP